MTKNSSSKFLYGLTIRQKFDNITSRLGYLLERGLYTCQDSLRGRQQGLNTEQWALRAHSRYLAIIQSIPDHFVRSESPKDDLPLKKNHHK